MGAFFPRDDSAGLFSVALVCDSDDVHLLNIRGDFLERVLDSDGRDIHAAFDNNLLLAACEVKIPSSFDDFKAADVSREEVPVAECRLAAEVAFHDCRTLHKELVVSALVQEL